MPCHRSQSWLSSLLLGHEVPLDRLSATRPCQIRDKNCSRLPSNPFFPPPLPASLLLPALSIGSNSKPRILNAAVAIFYSLETPLRRRAARAFVVARIHPARILTRRAPFPSIRSRRNRRIRSWLLRPVSIGRSGTRWRAATGTLLTIQVRAGSQEFTTHATTGCPSETYNGI